MNSGLHVLYEYCMLFPGNRSTLHSNGSTIPRFSAHVPARRCGRRPAVAKQSLFLCPIGPHGKSGTEPNFCLHKMPIIRNCARCPQFREVHLPVTVNMRGVGFRALLSVDGVGENQFGRKALSLQASLAEGGGAGLPTKPTRASVIVLHCGKFERVRLWLSNPVQLMRGSKYIEEIQEHTNVQDGIVVLMENSSVSNQISQLDLESQSKPTGFFVDEHQMKKQDPKYILIHPSIHQG